MQVEVITPRKIEFQDQADTIILPTQMGEISVLPSHAPLVSVLKPGKIRIRTKKEEVVIQIEGGVLEVLGEKVTILLKNFNVQ
jgi:F-type H+-transporting ATPase subunit epsilon